MSSASQPPIDPVEPDALVFDTLIAAQQALRDFSATFGRGDFLADLELAQKVAAAAASLEAATWLSIRGNITYDDLGKHLGISRQAVGQHMSGAQRRIEGRSIREPRASDRTAAQPDQGLG